MKAAEARRKRTEEALKARERQQAAVAELGQRALAGTHPSVLMDRAVALVAKALNVEYCKVLQLLPDGKALRLRAGVGWKEGLVGLATVPATATSQAGYTLASKKPVIVEDLRTDKRFKGPPLLRDHGVVSGISVIIHGQGRPYGATGARTNARRALTKDDINYFQAVAKTGDQGRPYGVMGVHTTERRAFTKDDVNFLQAVANVLASVIGRKRTDEELRRKTSEIEAILEAVPDLYFRLDSDGTIVDYKAGQLSQLRVQRKEFLGRRAQEVLPSKVGQQIDEAIQQVIKTESSVTIEFSLPMPNGEQSYEAGLSPLPEGEIIVVVRDVSERKRAEEALRESEVRYRDLYEEAPVAYIAVGFDGRILKANQHTVALLGYDVDALVGRSVLDLHPDKEHAKRVFERFRAGEDIRDEEMEISRADGTSVWISLTVQICRDAQGQIVESRSMMMDITERRRAEEALAERENLLQTIIETEPECVKLITADGAVLEMNRAGLDMIEADSFDQVKGACVYQIVAPEHRRSFKALARRVFQGECGTLEFEIVGLKGTRRWLETRAVPLRNKKGEVDALLGVTRDITERKRAEEASRESEEKYSNLFHRSNDGIFLHDLKGNIIDVNQKVLDQMGYTKSELLSLKVVDLHPPEALPASKSALENISCDGFVRFEIDFKKKNGEVFPAEVSASLFEVAGRKVVQGVVRDITERKRADEGLRLIMEGTSSVTGDDFFRSLVRNLAAVLNVRYAMVGELVDGVQDRVSTFAVWAGEDFGENFQYDLAGTPCKNVVGKKPCHYPRGVQELFPDDHLLAEMEVESYLGVPLLDSAGNALGLLSVLDEQPMEEATSAKAILSIFAARAGAEIERKQAEETIRHQAYHDALTELPNRALFKEHLDLALAQARRNKRMLAVMFVGLDRFKLINDTVGRDAGDQLLRSVAGSLSSVVSEGDTVARLGGDEFALLLPAIGRAEEAVSLAERVSGIVGQPRMLAGQEFHITASIGIAIYPNDGKNAETLLRNVDTAVHRAKEQGGNGYQLYAPAMNAKILERLALENDLHHALERNEFVVYYQPQVDIATGRVIGAEALVRWQHPDLGLVFPLQFIPAAEETGLIVPIGEWVLRTACAQNKAWQDARLPSIRMAVNLSATQFQQQDLVETVARVLKEAGLDPRFLDLEIIESTAMQDADFSVATMRALREMGVQVSIDDFGTGYSSLNYLKRFPISAMKIDQSFVQDISEDSNSAAIVSTIIVLAQNMKLRSVAEGVETEEQLAFLKQRGCDEMQGFLFSRPVPADAFEKMLVAQADSPRPPKNGKSRKRRQAVGATR